ncbi:family 1 glycosyltransferase [Penicillium argentinense]|uniref:Family 1 glycosyltransferase n=1 Tax=Penicillium argentinense TaxID=1131581 RepID=A0A9W9KF78_9EURO|nr:family 1 glycosyltransferase [Penicillium argentinense]KAJ5104264.1 family 1 glycosyltransferase [Penicillium argentinense]
MALHNSSRPRKILLLTNVERGEANVFLATSHSLLQLEPNVELHFASFTGLEDTVSAVSEDVRRSVPEAKPIIFHKIEGLTFMEGVQDHLSREEGPARKHYIPESFLVQPSFSNTKWAIRDTIPIFVPYDGPQLVQLVSSIIEIINKVDADLVVVNSLMTAGLTASYHLGVKFVCLSPNALRDFAASTQPRAAGLWKFPALFSGYPYPVPWYRIPLNIYFTLYAVTKFVTDKRRQPVEKYLAEKTGAALRTPVDLIQSRSQDLKILVSTFPELDFPLIIPEHVIPCGPILRNASPSVAEADPDLGNWLARAPTIYVNLGTICQIAEDQAMELALALKTVLDTLKKLPEAQNLQVLWKIKKLGEYSVSEPGCEIEKVLGECIRADSMRIVDWLQAEPISILQSGHVVCSIHQGGANSYNEAVSSGVAQVVLPQWTDCYDYAQRVEMLGIGRLGSRKSKPQWSAPELSEELLHVLHGESSRAIKQKATELAIMCEKRGSGAKTAALVLLGECPKVDVE